MSGSWKNFRRRYGLALSLAAAAGAVALAVAAVAAPTAIPRAVDVFTDRVPAVPPPDRPRGRIEQTECDDCPHPDRAAGGVAREQQGRSTGRARPTVVGATPGGQPDEPDVHAAATAAPSHVPAAGPKPESESNPQPAPGSTNEPARAVAETKSKGHELPTLEPEPETGEQQPVEADEPPPEPSVPLVFRGVRVTATSPFSATVHGRTSVPARARVAYGPAAGEGQWVWTPPEAPATDHEMVVHGLSFGTRYELLLLAEDEFGRTVDKTVEVTTPRLGERTRATTADGRILLDGEPFFPRMVWARCATGYDASLAVGINAFMGNDCEDGAEQLARLDGRAFSITPAGDSAEGTGLIGSHLPDELDAHLPDGLSPGALERLIPPAADDRLTFLTLSSHVYSEAEPLPQGRGMYPTLIQRSDVVGFDLYPLQNWCRRDGFRHVYDAQRELVEKSRGKPTYQWIEVRDFDCRSDPALSVTPETVRAETWLAIAGGAHGIGYFPYDWSPAVGTEIARVNAEIDALAPALLEPATEVRVDPAGAVKATVRDHNGALYVIAVNATRQRVDATLTVPDLGDRRLLPVGDGPQVTAEQDEFAETFEPLAVRVWVAAPLTP